MTRYTELRHAGYFNPNLSDAEKKKIEKQVDGGDTRTETPAESTVFAPAKTPAATKATVDK